MGDMKRRGNRRGEDDGSAGRKGIGRGTRARLYKLVLLLLLVALYKGVAYLFTTAFWVLHARIVLLAVIIALLLNLLFPAK